MITVSIIDDDANAAPIANAGTDQNVPALSTAWTIGAVAFVVAGSCQSKGWRLMIVCSRSGPVEIISMGIPASSSIRAR